MGREEGEAGAPPHEGASAAPNAGVVDAQRSLQENQELFRALTLYSGDIVSLLDGEGRLLYNSPATERINGFTPEELANIDTFEMIHPDDRAHVREVFARVLAAPGAVHTVQYRYLTKHGTWLWMEAIASNQLHNPAVRGVVANSRDVSERLRGEEERARMQDQMLHVQKLESLGVLAGGVAHDFNNLLTVMLGEASLLRAKHQSDSVRESAQRIYDAAERAAELTQLLLAYAGKGRLSLETTCLGALVRDMQPLLEITAGRQNQLSVELDAGHCLIDADPRQLRQVVLNLVQNAGESAERPVHIELRAGRHELAPPGIGECAVGGPLAPGPYVVLEVSDDGKGMSAEARQRIFDPFFSTKQTGRGLGLAAVCGIVSSHCAGLTLCTSDPGGTRFQIYFPAAPAAAARAPQASARDTGAKLRGTALVVDDDHAAARTTCRLLEALGMATVTAASGREALELYDRCEIEIVVLDMVMPEMDGAETFSRLRELAPAVPVLLYSGYDDEIAAKCVRQPKTAFLQKPFTPEQLQERIAGLTQKRSPPE